MSLLREYRITELDTLSYANWDDVVVVFAHLGHARDWWHGLTHAIVDKHGSDYVVRTQRALVSKRTHHSIQGWLPMEQQLPRRFLANVLFMTPAATLPRWVERQIEYERKARRESEGRLTVGSPGFSY